MQLINSNDKYGALSIGIHWLMFFLLVAVYSCIELREFYPKGSELREAFKTWHFILGLTVFILVLLRVILRFLQRQPIIKPAVKQWQVLTAKAMHAALYLLMLSMPILGWLVLSAKGRVIPFYGLSLPALIAENPQAADLIETIHTTFGTFGYYLIGLHMLAALFHHYLIKDNTLLRMLPSSNKRK
jgi:cytochrome b561